MLLIREVFHCKPGKVRPLLEKFVAMNALSEKVGMPRSRLMTDLSAPRYWTLVAEFEVANMQAFDDMMQPKPGQDEAAMKEFESIMKGYHDLVDSGHREIYKIEA